MLRFLVPLAVAAVVAGGVAFASASRSDSATPTLPPRSAEQLLAEVAQARVPGLSGTVVSTARLGLPELPSVAGRGGVSLTDLVAGSHTVRVWLKGRPLEGRIRVLDDEDPLALLTRMNNRVHTATIRLMSHEPCVVAIDPVAG